jgi:transcriptional regulator with XRE-family HTH domain
MVVLASYLQTTIRIPQGSFAGTGLKLLCGRQELMIGTAIKLVRNSLGISASEVALKAGIARSHLWRLERGEERPGYDVLCRVAGACCIPASQLCRIAESLEAAKPLPGLAAEFESAVKSHARKNARIGARLAPKTGARGA